MRTTYGRFLAAGAAFGSGIVGALFVGINATTGGVVAWPLALGLGLTAGGVGGYVGLDTTTTPTVAADLKGRAAPLLVVVTLTLGLFGILASVWVGTDGSLTDPVGGLAVATGVTLIGYFGLLLTSESLSLERVTTASDIRVELPHTVWGQRWARYRRPMQAVVTVAVVVLAWLALVSETYVLTVYALAGVHFLVQSPTAYEITGAGLRKGRSLLPWERFESFRFEADVLVLETGGRGRTGIRFPRAAIDDEAAVREALATVLDGSSET